MQDQPSSDPRSGNNFSPVTAWGQIVIFLYFICYSEGLRCLHLVCPFALEAQDLSQAGFQALDEEEPLSSFASYVHSLSPKSSPL